MDVIVRQPIARDLDAILNERPDINIIYRCLDCQTFLLPSEISLIVARFRDESGAARSIPHELCPVCHPTVARPESPDLIPESPFVVLTREDYEQTKQAEKWGLVYDPRTKKTESRLLIT